MRRDKRRRRRRGRDSVEWAVIIRGPVLVNGDAVCLPMIAWGNISS